MRVAVVIRERVPANVVAEREMEGDERWTPPAATPVIMATRAPRPVVVVIDPASVMIRSPTPRFIPNPGPTVRRTPGPATVAVWRPVVIVVDDCDVGTPNPTVLVCILPVAVSVEILCPPDVVVVILRIVAKNLRKISLTIFDPAIPGII